MALKKSQLYSSLWASCDELRGGMDASQYKDYVLTLLFMKYVSDKYAGEKYALLEIPEGGSFDDMRALDGDKEIGDKMNKIIKQFAEANDLENVIDQADFNDTTKLGSGKEMQDRLAKLVKIFATFDFTKNRASDDDLLGDAYEYLMRNFATESGKSKGQFYTPSEVSRIMAQIIGISSSTPQDKTIYDPTCGSGSLLLKAADEAPNGLTIYGQEKDNTTWGLARMNMILHNYATATIELGSTLANPRFTSDDGALMTFDFAVANPPFSDKAWTSGVTPDADPYNRFEYGVPPNKNGDYAFLLHLIKSLKSNGRGAIILPHGVLFRGNKEADIRRELLRRGFIKGIIGLPANLFYGTGIPACIIVIDKGDAQSRTGVFMIDASKGFIKDGNKNRLRSQDIHRIVDTFNKQVEHPGYARMVPLEEVADASNDYNLNIPRYIDSSDAEDIHDLSAHLQGGIPRRDVDALEAYWQVFPSLRDALFEDTGRTGYVAAKVDGSEVKQTILNHPDFAAYREQVSAVFAAWQDAHTPLLTDLNKDSKPKQVIHALSEDLLARFGKLSLLDAYDVYQQLMAYWSETMQDDVYLVIADGWVSAAKPRPIIDDKVRKIEEKPDLTVKDGKKTSKHKLDLIPPELIAAHYFAADLATIDSLQAEQDAASQALEDIIEEHSGDEGLLIDALNDKGKLTKSSSKDRLKAIKSEPDSDDERAVLQQCLQLMDTESDAKSALKSAQAQLDKQVLDQYAALSEDDIKQLVVFKKWFADIRAGIAEEVQRLTQQLAERVKELEGRYAEPLPELTEAVDARSDKVAAHLAKMGLAVA